MRRFADRAFRYGPPAGDPDLRQQIADRIRAARGIARSADQIVVTSGAQQALDICVRLLLDPGDHIVVEDPGYAAAHAVFTAAGAKVIRVPVDGTGPRSRRSCRADRSPVRAIYVTPSHQFPTGAVMPAARRYALLEWAKRRGAYVIEDDYDGEFRYVGRPIAALAGLEAEGTVIYCGTFAKSLFPSLRLGYLAVPAGLARGSRERQVAVRPGLVVAAAADADAVDGDRRIRSPHPPHAEAISRASPGAADGAQAPSGCGRAGGGKRRRTARRRVAAQSAARSGGAADRSVCGPRRRRLLDCRSCDAAAAARGPAAWLRADRYRADSARREGARRGLQGGPLSKQKTRRAKNKRSEIRRS